MPVYKELHLHKNWIWYSFYGNANDYRDKSGETRSFVLNRQFCLDIIHPFSAPLLTIKQGFYAE